MHIAKAKLICRYQKTIVYVVQLQSAAFLQSNEIQPTIIKLIKQNFGRKLKRFFFI